MKTATFAVTLFALPLVMGCAGTTGTQTTVVTATTVTSGDTCGAAAYQHHVGAHSPQISVPAGTEMRHYRSGDPLTRDRRLDRLNFEYDRSGRLVSVTCG